MGEISAGWTPEDQMRVLGRVEPEPDPEWALALRRALDVLAAANEPRLRPVIELLERKLTQITPS